MGTALVGVGVGPGDPDLVTARAVRVLRQARRVFAPTTAVDAVGRAESVVRQAAPDVGVERLVFPMVPTGDPAGAQGVRRAAERVADELDSGGPVAFATLGDPNVYSTFTALARRVRALRPDVEVGSVPGIMAFQDLAARAGTVLLEGTERLTVVAALDGAGALDGTLDDGDQAVVVYKGGRHLPAIARRLAEAGRLHDAVFGELLGLPGQRVAAAADVADSPAAYLATLIVPPRARAAANGGPPS